ncbi:hypothetical protein ACIGKQ_09570 [Gordonia sp. NPDC062954]|uniref:hypothetical protein n=1 Tax=Gordonia sp. NPDC062954 TaxID=3364003 RepID=UPI0037C602EE
MIALAAAAVTLGPLTGCGSGDHDPDGPSSSRPATAAVAPVDAAECRERPAGGRIDRAGHDLEFRSGSMHVAIAGTGADGAAGSACYGFTKWGNADPSVPPDSLLFVFTGPGDDGAQLELLVGDLTGGVLPPIGGVRPRVGPLDAPIDSSVGVTVGGTYYHSATCQLTVTAMSSERAAGTFTCSAATRSHSNPFAPNEDIDEDSETETTVSDASVTLSGWFETTP